MKGFLFLMKELNQLLSKWWGGYESYVKYCVWDTLVSGRKRAVNKGNYSECYQFDFAWNVLVCCENEILLLTPGNEAL